MKQQEAVAPLGAPCECSVPVCGARAAVLISTRHTGKRAGARDDKGAEHVHNLRLDIICSVAGYEQRVAARAYRTAFNALLWDTRHRVLLHNYSLLWVDMTVSLRDPAAFESFQSLFRVHRLSALASIESEIERLKPDGLCFDFDFPTKQGLQLLQETKQKHRSLPILMLTVQHSEALAVWSFRSRVWDYLVKPLPTHEVQRCLTCLAEMMSFRERSPRKAAMPVSVIPEENRAQPPRGQQPQALAAAISYVEQNFRGKVTSAKAATLCRLSTFQFSRLFRETYGLTFQEYLIRFRIREACRLLKNPNAQVADVAFLVGFNDPSYFTKVFRRYTNVSPSRYPELHGMTLDPESLLEVLNGD